MEVLVSAGDVVVPGRALALCRAPPDAAAASAASSAASATPAASTSVGDGHKLEGDDGLPATARGVAGGAGTYEEDGKIFASLVGQVVLSPADGVVSVTAEKRTGTVPLLKSEVTGRITKVNPRFAVMDIVCVGSKSVEAGFHGTIRKENVRSFEIDKVEMHNSFRQGDIVRAMVASLGTARSYDLTTAETHLGVVSARSEANAVLAPLNFEEMRCAETGTVEKRKVAKITK